MTRGKSRCAKGSAEYRFGNGTPTVPGAACRALRPERDTAQSVGAAMGSTPARSSRVTRIKTAVMISPKNTIPAETR
jgi:hypothetical protein